MAGGYSVRSCMLHCCLGLHINRSDMFLWVVFRVLITTHNSESWCWCNTKKKLDDIIAPSLSYPCISLPICVLINLNICMHYYYAATVSPGFVDDPPHDSANSSFLRAPKPNSDTVTNLNKKKMSTTPIDRTIQSEFLGVKITPASTTNCLKCEKPRPEVLINFFF